MLMISISLANPAAPSKRNLRFAPTSHGECTPIASSRGREFGLDGNYWEKIEDTTLFRCSFNWISCSQGIIQNATPFYPNAATIEISGAIVQLGPDQPTKNEEKNSVAHTPA
jgi:hypothetical protein